MAAGRLNFANQPFPLGLSRSVLCMRSWFMSCIDPLDWPLVFSLEGIVVVGAVVVGIVVVLDGIVVVLDGLLDGIPVVPFTFWHGAGPLVWETVEVPVVSVVVVSVEAFALVDVAFDEDVAVLRTAPVAASLAVLVVTPLCKPPFTAVCPLAFVDVTSE